jgi:sporulation protein YlmC with PRC-barrel domain
VFATDSPIGTVYEIGLDPITGELEAFWVRTTGPFTHDMRIPAEWVVRLGMMESMSRRAGARLR